MLILSRKIGEALTIGETVTIAVVGHNGNQVRLGITAPKDCRSIAQRFSLASSLKTDLQSERHLSNRGSGVISRGLWTTLRSGPVQSSEALQFAGRSLL